MSGNLVLGPTLRLLVVAWVKRRINISVLLGNWGSILDWVRLAGYHDLVVQRLSISYMVIFPQQLFLNNLTGNKNPYKSMALQPVPPSELLSPVFTGYEVRLVLNTDSQECNSWTPAINIDYKTSIYALSTCTCQTVTKIEWWSWGSGNTEIPNIKIHCRISS